MSVVDNSAPLFFHSSHFNRNNNKFNPLSRVLKENINKIYKMQHFTTLGNAAYKFFKTFRANPAWSKCVGRDRGGGGGLNIFAKIDSTRARSRSDRVAIIVVRTFSWEILVLGLSHHLMTTPNSTISEPYKHLTIAKVYIARQIAPWRKRHIWVWSVSDVSSQIRVRAALPC